MGKKNKKTRKKNRQHLMDLNFDQLVNQGDVSISSGKPRDAVKNYKLALKMKNTTEQLENVRYRLFKAYLLREKELRLKKMLTEAENIKKQLMKHMPELHRIDLETMRSFIETCDSQDAFETCSNFFRQHGVDTGLEVVLAERLIRENCWDLLDSLDDSLHLKKDAAIAKNAVPLMNKAKWEDAADSMKGLPRTSPFAHIRMFCKAMSSFHDGNDKKMSKAISLIPEESFFKTITDTLASSTKCIAEQREITGDINLVNCLWKGSANIWKDAQRLIFLTEKGQFPPEMDRLLISFSNQIFPDAPEYARQYLLETLWEEGHSSEKKFIKMERGLLKKNTTLMQTKRRIVFFDAPLKNAVIYLDRLKKSIPPPDDQTISITESIIILHICRYLINSCDYHLLMHIDNQTRKRFNISAQNDFETAFLQLAERGIQCDPGNRPLYELVAQLDCVSRDSKKLKESLLLSMCEKYPDDPHPCIELASLYHGKNAFRKAENILKKAMELAPYDSRVQDQHVISLIISADKNITHERFHLVWQDIEKAARFDSRKNDILLAEKKIFYKICEKPEIPEKIIKLKLDEFNNFNRLKIISMMRMDVENKPKNGRKKILRKIESLFKSELKRIKDISSEEFLNLLLPFPREWKYVFKNLSVNRLFFKTSSTILSNLNNGDLLRLIDLTLTPEYDTFFQKEVEKRLKKTRPVDSLLKFYSLTLQGIIYDEWDIPAYQELIENADPETEKKLRASGNTLSRHTDGPSRLLLQSFDFEMMEKFTPSSPFDYFMDEDGDNDDDFDEIFNPFGGDGFPDINGMPEHLKKIFAKEAKAVNPKEFNQIFNEIKEDLEEFIDETGLRGLPKPLLKQLKPSVTKEPFIKNHISLLNLIFEAEGKQKLSREAKTLFLS